MHPLHQLRREHIGVQWPVLANLERVAVTTVLLCTSYLCGSSIHHVDVVACIGSVLWLIEVEIML
jgi:hypothetical protein